MKIHLRQKAALGVFVFVIVLSVHILYRYSYRQTIWNRSHLPEKFVVNENLRYNPYLKEMPVDEIDLHRYDSVIRLVTVETADI